MTVLVTGAAGFIGFHVTKALLARGERVVGIDSLNAYYDVSLKTARLELLEAHDNFTFRAVDVSDQSALDALLEAFPDIDRVVHLAAQAGVRYSIENPHAYVTANLVGHLNMLEFVRHLPVCQHFVYASSSSVYGANTKLPFSVDDPVETPISLYAATKRADELMSYSYSHLYKLPATGLRFFTVYGPWGRPDMSAFLFTKAILAGEEISVFNNGDMRRNFTYVDDIVAGVLACLDRPSMEDVPHRLYNIGNDKAEGLMGFIHTLEELLGQSAQIKFLPMQKGDVKETIADITMTRRDLGFSPKTNMRDGLIQFVRWYKEYYGA